MIKILRSKMIQNILIELRKNERFAKESIFILVLHGYEVASVGHHSSLMAEPNVFTKAAPFSLVIEEFFHSNIVCRD